ncbi:MAG: hypothetical protein IPO45_06485 [Saprospiraceae bacterium]|jgi:hypothetical protein|uniref:hypothetical protein n=1 Tax=Candidatus Brachybacter algidus TaxID=2982024 RepID=UPI001B60ABF0|nr:hypothetical protein [Candidatus Brachybacter algidus]MBP7305013.1 hypothetical protein [Saprospiraceae bacterium]MBK6375125.1 hypothetical protein [Candidatus Brachybacter algidus]MBK6450530.1 hypothetical protein [Candidatus Brachybacter algidus]MBK8356200.1 hypothetical protein [Candidatus Brachybacter algidus]MBK8842535.1 hypothetical protein [Candidatus Brachybacter algidus]
MNCSIRKNSITYIEDSPQLIFLTYKVYNKDNKYSAVLVDSITKPGKLKDNDKTLAVNISGNYQIKQSDQKSKELSSIYVADVLTKSVEYADDKGQFQKRIFKLDSAFISVRMDLLPATSVITLSRINDDLKKKVLTKTTIHK